MTPAIAWLILEPEVGSTTGSFSSGRQSPISGNWVSKAMYIRITCWVAQKLADNCCLSEWCSMQQLNSKWKLSWWDTFYLIFFEICFFFPFLILLTISMCPYLVCESDFVKTKATSEKYFSQNVLFALLKHDKNNTFASTKKKARTTNTNKQELQNKNTKPIKKPPQNISYALVFMPKNVSSQSPPSPIVFE